MNRIRYYWAMLLWWVDKPIRAEFYPDSGQFLIHDRMWRAKRPKRENFQ